MNLNSRLAPRWAKATTATTQGTTGGTVITPVSDYVIIDNQSGGNLTICPAGSTTGILITPGETFETAFMDGATFTIVNAGSGNAVFIWLY